MALRGGPTRRLPGNPLAGVLRDMERQSRRTTRSTGRRPAQQAAPEAGEGRRGPRGPAGPAGQPGPPSTAATVAVTGDDGRVRWEFPAPYPAAPVLGALPAGDVVVVPVLEEVTEAYAVVRLWSPLHGVVGAGVSVHLTATAAEPS